MVIARVRRRDRRVRQPRAEDAARTLRRRCQRVGLTVSRRHQRPRGGARRRWSGCDVVFHQAAIRITQCAEEPRLAFDVMVDGTFNVVEAAVAADVGKVGAGIVGLGLRHGREFPTTELHHPYGNRTLYGAAKAFDEMPSAPSTRCTTSTTSRCATSTCTGPAWRSRRRTPRCWSVGWSASRPASRRSSSATAPRPSTSCTSTTWPRANVLAATSPVTDDVFNVGSGEETSLRQLADALLRVMGSPTSSPSSGRNARVNPVPRRLADPTPVASASASSPRSSSKTGCAGSSSWWRSEQRPTPRRTRGRRVPAKQSVTA